MYCKISRVVIQCVHVLPNAGMTILLIPSSSVEIHSSETKFKVQLIRLVRLRKISIDACYAGMWNKFSFYLTELVYTIVI